MSIIFKAVRWKNLLSTGNIFTEVNLCEHPSTLIVGENGAGKSTFIEAVSYALYGKPFRKINKPQLINTINKKNMLVELEFTTGNKDFLIRRGMKPNIFEIIQDGTMINQDAAIKDYQEYLEKNIIKLNHKSFSQIVTLGSRSFIPFMQLPAQHRREVIEDLLDLQIFSVMNIILKNKVSDNKNDIRELKYNSDLIQEKIILQKDYIKSIQSNNERQIELNRSKLNDLDAQITDSTILIETYTQQVEDLSDQIKDHDSIISKMQNLTLTKSQFDDKVSKLVKEIKFYDTNDNCPTCKQGIEHTFKCETIESKTSQVEEFKTAMNQIDEKYEIMLTRLNEISEVQNQITSINRQITEQNLLIKTNYDFKKKIEADIVRLSEEHKANTEDHESLQH